MTINRGGSYFSSYFKNRLDLASYFRLAKGLRLVKDLRPAKSLSSRCLSGGGVSYSDSY